MLRNASKLKHDELRARDGKIGHVDDLFFDDHEWVVRYLVVDTGTWLDSRKVLISPVVVRRIDATAKLIAVDLTQEQVRNSPGIDTEPPVSREHEAALIRYYDWPAYWGAAGFPDVGFAAPTVPMIPIDLSGTSGTDDPRLTDRPASDLTTPSADERESHHLRSVRAVTGHTIEATDGHIGHVDDFLMDDQDWRVKYLVVDTRNWWPGKKVVIAPQWIREVGWNQAKVYVDLTRAAVKTSPPYDAEKVLSPEYSVDLHEHYARTRHHRP